MSEPQLRPATLDPAALDALVRLEQRLGACVVAYEPESPYATLTPEQLDEIQATESALGVRLLAFRPSVAAG